MITPPRALVVRPKSSASVPPTALAIRERPTGAGGQIGQHQSTAVRTHLRAQAGGVRRVELVQQVADRDDVAAGQVHLQGAAAVAKRDFEVGQFVADAQAVAIVQFIHAQAAEDPQHILPGGLAGRHVDPAQSQVGRGAASVHLLDFEVGDRLPGLIDQPDGVAIGHGGHVDFTVGVDLLEHIVDGEGESQVDQRGGTAAVGDADLAAFDAGAAVEQFEIDPAVCKPAKSQRQRSSAQRLVESSRRRC